MNPWEEISLSDYENHMSLDSVKQLQAMNEMMKKQLEEYPVNTAMIFGIAGGNGLEHVKREKYIRICGIDINEEYLAAVKERYSKLQDILECHRIDLMAEIDKLPQADLVIANLFIEYVGYDTFAKAVLKSEAKYVSCIIQLNTDDKTWVSDSPYLHAFDGLDAVHHQMDETSLTKVMNEIGYTLLKTEEYPLPNGKKLVMLDYGKMNNLVIRDAQVDDAQRLVEIYSYYVLNTAVSFEYDAPSVEEFQNRILKTKEKYPYLVCLKDNRIIGYVYAGAYSSREAYSWTVSTSIYIDKDYRRCGVGSMLYKALEEELKKQGIINLLAGVAYIDEEDEYLSHDSYKFHLKEGYSEVAHMKSVGKKFDRWYDLMWFQKKV